MNREFTKEITLLNKHMKKMLCFLTRVKCKLKQDRFFNTLVSKKKKKLRSCIYSN